MRLDHPAARRTENLISSAQERFYGCDVCRPDDSYDLIEDVLKPLLLRERERVRLFGALTCPGCESRVQSGMWVVGLDRGELRRLSLSKKFDRLYSKEAEQFRGFLVQYPTQGMEHPFGRMLAQAVRLARKTRLEPGSWFHAGDKAQAVIVRRTREAANKAGRFHQIGQIALYAAEDARTAVVEKLRQPESKREVMLFEIEVHEALPVLDLRGSPWGVNSTESWLLGEVRARGFASEPVNKGDESCPQYRVPQFIADLARRAGFRGILYESTRPSAYNNPDAHGFNLVLFEPVPEFRTVSAELVEFGNTDYEAFTVNRWPLRPANTSPPGMKAPSF